MRNLEESSWLAQTIADRAEIEFDRNGASARWNCLNTLRIIVREADSKENHSIYYDNYDGNLGITICDIRSMSQYGSDYDTDGMRAKLRGMAERYKDFEGNYIVHVLTTHDLNSATISSIQNLLLEMAR